VLLLWESAEADRSHRVDSNLTQGPETLNFCTLRADVYAPTTLHTTELVQA